MSRRPVTTVSNNNTPSTQETTMSKSTSKKTAAKKGQTITITTLAAPVIPTTPPADAKPARAARPPKAEKAPKGLDRDAVVELLRTQGLPMVHKSSDHYGDPKGARLVLPMARSVTRVYLYRMEGEPSLPGYHTPEQRKEKGLGKVTHVVDVDASGMDTMRLVIMAVAVANGLQLTPSVPQPTSRRPAKASKAQAKKAQAGAAS